MKIKVKMSDNIPIEIQAEIFKRLPVLSLIQLRSVCKAWKSLIDSADFINNYSGHTEHLLARYKDPVDVQEEYVLIVDDHTFPQKIVSLNSHLLANMLRYHHIIGSSYGLLCLYGDHQQGCDGPTGRAVLWNPSIRKAVAVDVPHVSHERIYETTIGFGVSREATTDPKIVKITYILSRWIDVESIKSVSCIPWQVEVFTLSTKAWRPPYSTNLPRITIHFEDYQVVIDGMLYWLATDRNIVDGGFQSYNLIISFDIKSEEFTEINLPDSLAHQSNYNLSIYKLRETLIVLERGEEANNLNFCVWMMEDVVPKSFTKLFTINIPDNVSEAYVTGFRMTGEPIINSATRYPAWTGSLAIYERYSKSIQSLRIDGSAFSDFVFSHIETLLLL